MLFGGKLVLPLRLRLLLALIAAAGAGIFLTYSGLQNAAGSFALEETGEKLFLRLTLAGEAVEKEVNSDMYIARAIAGRAAVGETLARLASGSAQPGDRQTLSARLSEAAAAWPAIKALQLVDTRGDPAAASGKAIRAWGISARSRLNRRPDGAYALFPASGLKAPEYGIGIPVRAEGKAGRTAVIGELRCLFSGAPFPADDGGSGAAALSLAERGAGGLRVAGAGGTREIAMTAEEAAPFLSALEGKEGYTLVNTREGKTLYAYRRLSVPGWILTAATPYTSAARRVENMLAAARLTALLSFALLAITAFLAAGPVLRPLSDTARAAGVFLEECGKGCSETATNPDTELIDRALSEAAAQLKARGRNGAELETETEKLREEDADLKYQNAELEKLNKYLLDREIKISELKKEISELKEKFTREPAE